MRFATGLLGATVLLTDLALAAEATAMPHCPMMQGQLGQGTGAKACQAPA